MVQTVELSDAELFALADACRAEIARRESPPDVVGVASVLVSPDVSGFDAALRLELAAIFGRLERDIRATVG